MSLEENSVSALPLTSLAAFIFDLDGVIWRGHTPIEGAVESVTRLRAAGKKCFYCTNNSRLTQSAFADRLRAIGLELDDRDVISSAWATAQFLAKEYPSGFSAFVVGEDGLKDTLRAIGATIISEEEADSGALAECMVAGIDRDFNYEKLRIAQRQILRGARFIATNRDSTFPTEDGVVPGSGSIIAALETASGTIPLSIGKPAPLMLQLCVEEFGLDPLRTAMIGDRLDTDIACAHRAGLPALLVTTGVTSREVALAAKGEEAPDAIFDDLPAMLNAVL
jgi:phosphoglycolate/pyridoxal phosphate phosphatase family enzyme